MTICWHLWKCRNKTIFEASFQRPNNPNLLIKRFVKDIEECNLQPFHNGPQLTKSIYVGWKRLQEGWIKLNSDDACKDRGKIADCGGLFHDSDGRWIKGYTKKIGACDALHVEKWEVVFEIGHGLERAFFSSNSGERLNDFDRHDF